MSKSGLLEQSPEALFELGFSGLRIAYIQPFALVSRVCIPAVRPSLEDLVMARWAAHNAMDQVICNQTRSILDDLETRERCRSFVLRSGRMLLFEGALSTGWHQLLHIQPVIHMIRSERRPSIEDRGRQCLPAIPTWGRLRPIKI